MQKVSQLYVCDFAVEFHIIVRMSLFCDAYFFYQNFVSRADFWILLHLSINFGRIQIDIRVKFVSKNTIFFHCVNHQATRFWFFVTYASSLFASERIIYNTFLTFISSILGAQCLQASPCFALIVLYYRADCQFHNTATQCFLPSDCLSAIILTISMGNIVVFNTIRLKPLRIMHFNSYSLMLFLFYVWLCSTACVFASSALVSVIFVRAALLLTATNIFLHMATYKLLRLFFNASTSRI